MKNPIWLPWFAAFIMVGCGGHSGDSAAGPPPPAAVPPAAAPPAIMVQPAAQTATVGQTATFSVTAGGDAPLTYQWQRNGAAITGATAAIYTTPAAAAGDDGSLFAVVVSNAAGSVTSAPAKLSVSTAATPARGTDVTTYKNDLSRSGQNLTESALNVANVNSAGFGLRRNLPVDGKVDAQPLYLSALSVSGGTHNVVYVATEHGSVYAIDADTGSTLWRVSLLRAGESTSPPNGCNQIAPEIGITSTPVIDRSAGAHGTLFAVAMSKDGAGNYHQRLHALDAATGAELLNGPTEISATYPSGSGTVTFSPGNYAERAALLLSGNALYLSFTSHCDGQPYSGWIMAYGESTLTQSAVLNIGPNSAAGPAIWMSGGGPAADSAGNIYLLSANGAFETDLDPNGFPDRMDFGNSFLKISTAGKLDVADYFAMSNEVAESNADLDLGSGGAMLLPDLRDAAGAVQHLVIGAGKDANIYVVSRDSMGKFNAGSNAIYQELDGVLPGGIWSTPAYFNGNVYYCDVGGTLKMFPIGNAKLAALPSSQSTVQFIFPGTAPAISAHGSANGIVWAHENTSPAVLHAYDAGNLAHELYNSNQAAGGRDRFGAGNKFITPAIADGKVFVGTTNSVAVFGLLP